MRTFAFALIDGTLAGNTIHTRELVEQMARDLIRFDAVADERDAVRALTWCERYSPYDVVRLAPDARHAAIQMQVAAEMSRS